MRLTACEWCKLFRLPALWAFAALCLAFNCLLIFTETYGRDFFNDASAAAADLGQRVNASFLSGLADDPRTENRDLLLAAAGGLENIYETYDVGILSAFYGEQVKKSPLAVGWMEWKYEKLAPRVEHLAQTGAALDLYAGPVTHDSHQFLFGTLMRAITAEGAILGMLAALYLLGYENQHRTALTVYSSRTGRRLCLHKIAAGAAASAALYLLLAAASLGLHFALWDYSGVWAASVSSQFNYLVDLLYSRPFLTWTDFTVAGYLAAAVALGVVLTVIFSLLAAVCGILAKNTYLAALLLTLFCLGIIGAMSAAAALKLWPAYFALRFQPLSIWLSAGGWFTELGLSAVVPWQETVTAALDLTLLSLGAALALKRFSGKDVV